VQCFLSRSHLESRQIILGVTQGAFQLRSSSLAKSRATSKPTSRRIAPSGPKRSKRATNASSSVLLGPMAGAPQRMPPVLFERPNALVLDCRPHRGQSHEFFIDIVDWARWLESHLPVARAAIQRASGDAEIPHTLSVIVRLTVSALDASLESRILAMRYPVEVIGPRLGGPKSAARRTYNWPKQPPAALSDDTRRPITTPAFIDTRIDSLWRELMACSEEARVSRDHNEYDWRLDSEVRAARAYALLVTIASNLLVMQATNSIGAGPYTKRIARHIDGMTAAAMAALKGFIAAWPFERARDWKGSARLKLPDVVLRPIRTFSADARFSAEVLPSAWENPVPGGYENLLHEMAYPAQTAADGDAASELTVTMSKTDAEMLQQANFGMALVTELAWTCDQPVILHPGRVHDVDYLRQSLTRTSCCHRLFLEHLGLPDPRKRIVLGLLQLASALSRGMAKRTGYPATTDRGVLTDARRVPLSLLAKTGQLQSDNKTANGLRVAKSMEKHLLRMLRSLI